MLRHLFPVLGFAVALAAPLPAASASPEQAQRLAALSSYQHDLISILVLRADAPHLLGAALLARPLADLRPGQDYARLIQRAAQADPDNAAVSWVRLAECDDDGEPCPNMPALHKLQQLAPNNAAVWVLSLNVAARNHDRQAELDALTKAAAASTYDDYAGTILKAVVESVTSLPVPPKALAAYAGTTGAGAASAQFFLAFGLAEEQLRPSLLPVVTLCDPRHNEDAAALNTQCLQLARQLAWGSSMQARAAGLHLLDVLAETDADRARAREDLRNLSWQGRSFSRFSLKALDDQSLAVELLRLARNGGSQMSMMNAMLQRHAIPLQAPLDYQPAAASSAQAAETIPDDMPDARTTTDSDVVPATTVPTPAEAASAPPEAASAPTEPTSVPAEAAPVPVEAISAPEEAASAPAEAASASATATSSAVPGPAPAPSPHFGW